MLSAKGGVLWRLAKFGIESRTRFIWRKRTGQDENLHEKQKLYIDQTEIQCYFSPKPTGFSQTHASSGSLPLFLDIELISFATFTPG